MATAPGSGQLTGAGGRGDGVSKTLSGKAQPSGTVVGLWFGRFASNAEISDSC